MADDEILKDPEEERQQKVTKSKLDKDITFRVRPRKVLKGFIGIVVLVIVFGLGWFANDVSAGSTDSQESPLSLDLSSVSSYLTDMFAGSNETETSDATLADNETVANSSDDTAPDKVTAAATTDKKENDTPEKKAEENAEKTPVATSYAKADFVVDKVYTKPRDGWGKITGIRYTLDNQEAGVVRPHHFKLLVEGYGEEIVGDISVDETKYEVAPNAKETFEAAVDGGFAYNEATTGDLSSVEVTLILYDDSEKVIDSITKSVDLS